jgi:LysR family transcriptional activator of mexEF-oprN operon
VVVSHVANISSFADEWLDAIGRKRHAVLSVPQYSTLPALMAGTDLLCNLPDHLTQAMINTGRLYGEPLPFITPNLELSMTWLSVMDTDPAERWLRNRLEEFMGDRDRVSPIP